MWRRFPSPSTSAASYWRRSSSARDRRPDALAHAIGVELFENAAATAAGLYVLILVFGPISGAHFNPVVSFVDAAFGGLSWRDPRRTRRLRWRGARAARSSPTSCTRGPPCRSRPRPGDAGPRLAEVMATAGLLLSYSPWPARSSASHAPAAVGAYIGAAYFFTSSTSFANPAIAVAAMFSDTFAGISPSSVPPFVGAEVLGGVLAYVLVTALYPGVTRDDASRVVLPAPRHRGSTVTGRSTILFLCIQPNAGRSQMAAALARALGGDDVIVLFCRFRAGEFAQPRGDGCHAGERVRPWENSTVPQLLNDEMAMAADVVVTMGCGDACPIYRGSATSTGS